MQRIKKRVSWESGLVAVAIGKGIPFSSYFDSFQNSRELLSIFNKKKMIGNGTKQRKLVELYV